VEISDAYPNSNAQICRATLMPVAGSPFRAEGSCNMTWYEQGSRNLTATYLDYYEAFHSDTGSTPQAGRSINIMQIERDIFCDGFEAVSGCRR